MPQNSGRAIPPPPQTKFHSISQLAPQYLIRKKHPKQHSSISHKAPILSAKLAVAILNPVNRTKIPTTTPHDKPLENFATICKPSAVKITFQILKISMDVNKAPNAPYTSTIEFKLHKLTSISQLASS